MSTDDNTIGVVFHFAYRESITPFGVATTWRTPKLNAKILFDLSKIKTYLALVRRCHSYDGRFIYTNLNNCFIQLILFYYFIINWFIPQFFKYIYKMIYLLTISLLPVEHNIPTKFLTHKNPTSKLKWATWTPWKIHGDR